MHFLPNKITEKFILNPPTSISVERYLSETGVYFIREFIQLVGQSPPPSLC